MYNLFLQGGPLFMGILTVILISLLFVFISFVRKRGGENRLLQGLGWLKSIGTLGLVVGVLGQLIGLFTAFSIIETTKGISTEIMAGGLKVSLITTLYGLLIYGIHILCSMVLKRVY